ncbi:hypothetical protein GDO81_002215 [Engystomops pustulosus]|uniref:Ig-like domain-containing protein n=1 Tax=Engystomops pustulosus TaxID=76066 RepID=A0AAV7DI97_ENGPU|nr:hypothetical protein GDO81_002215 [Engystomops pustulosus]
MLEDDADYYCAMSETLWFLFGEGTQVTVLTGEVKPPFVVIYRPSEEELKTDKATIVCAATDFNPRPLTVEWIVDEAQRTTGVQASPVSKQTDNLYMKTSHLSMTASEYKAKQTISCTVTHQGKVITQTLKTSEC